MKMDYILSGILDPNPTGAYVCNGQYNGANYYELIEGGWFIWWNNDTKWILSEVLGTVGSRGWERTDADVLGDFVAYGTASGDAAFAPAPSNEPQVNPVFASVTSIDNLPNAGADWIGITGANLDSQCAGNDLTAVLNGENLWQDNNQHVHWFILDLKYSYMVSKIRGRSNLAADPIDVRVFVSDDKDSWGTAVKTGITSFQDTEAWQEESFTAKAGRYVKIEVETTEVGSEDVITWGKADPYMTIIDVYGCRVCALGSAAYPWEKIYGNTAFLANIKSGATQVAAGAAAGELWKTASHATLPDNVILVGV